MDGKEIHREKALKRIFKHFAKKGGVSPNKKATFDQMKKEKKYIDLQEFLLFCKHFEVPVNSRVQLFVYKRIIENSDQGKFSKDEFKDALILLFDEVSKQKLAKFESLIQKKKKLVSKVVVNGAVEDKDE